jgi:hypothetical protein
MINWSVSALIRVRVLHSRWARTADCAAERRVVRDGADGPNTGSAVGPRGV